MVDRRLKLEPSKAALRRRTKTPKTLSGRRYMGLGCVEQRHASRTLTGAEEALVPFSSASVEKTVRRNFSLDADSLKRTSRPQLQTEGEVTCTNDSWGPTDHASRGPCFSTSVEHLPTLPLRCSSLSSSSHPV